MHVRRAWMHFSRVLKVACEGLSQGPPIHLLLNSVAHSRPLYIAVQDHTKNGLLELESATASLVSQQTRG